MTWMRGIFLSFMLGAAASASAQTYQICGNCSCTGLSGSVFVCGGSFSSLPACTASLGLASCVGRLSNGTACTGSLSGGGCSVLAAAPGGGISGPAIPSPLIPLDPTGYRSPGLQRIGGGMSDFGASNPLGTFQGEASFTSHYTSSFEDWAEEAEARARESDDEGAKQLIEDYGPDYSAFHKHCEAYPKICALLCATIDCSEGDPRDSLKFLSTESVLPSPYGSPAGLFNAAGDPMPPPNTTAAYEYKFLGRVLKASGAEPYLSGNTPKLNVTDKPGEKVPAEGDRAVTAAASGSTARGPPAGPPKTGVSVPVVPGSALSPSGAVPGEPVTTVSYNKNISVEGTVEFQGKVTRDLNKISITSSGKALLKSIEGSGRALTIRSDEGKGNTASTDGSDVWISYSPERTSLADPTDPTNPYNKAKWAIPPNRPPDVGLFHELVHADDYMNGTLDPAMGVNLGPLAGTPIPNAELRAAGLIGSFAYSENTYRKERGLEPRDFY